MTTLRHHRQSAQVVAETNLHIGPNQKTLKGISLFLESTVTPFQNKTTVNFFAALRSLLTSNLPVSANTQGSDRSIYNVTPLLRNSRMTVKYRHFQSVEM